MVKEAGGGIGMSDGLALSRNSNSTSPASFPGSHSQTSWFEIVDLETASGSRKNQTDIPSEFSESSGISSLSVSDCAPARG